MNKNSINTFLISELLRLAFFKTTSIGIAKSVNKWAINDSNLACETIAAKSTPSVKDSINIFAVFNVDSKWTASSVALCNFAEALAFSEGFDRCFLQKIKNIVTNWVYC